MLGPSKYLVKQLKLKPNCLIGFEPKASICHKSELPPKKSFVRSFPYEKIQYNYLSMWLDPLTARKMNENSKIITIEGNVACGKEDFARRLANELGMLYLPMVDLESYFINDHGYDYRALNPLLPERLRHCDWEMFHENPSRHSVMHMQYYLFKLRLAQYLKALRHLCNTGQGVVIDRSVMTERVFVEAMHKLGWLPMGYLRNDGVRFYDFKLRYDHIRNLALAPLPKPHLTIYLSTPVETCMEKIKTSSDPMIANSQALVPEFLEAIEEAYMDVVLPKAEMYSHVMKIDYPERMDDDQILDVIYDIRDLDFEFDHRDLRFNTWEKTHRYWWVILRRAVSSYNCLTAFGYLNLHYMDIAGMGDSISEVDLKLREALYSGHMRSVGFDMTFESNWRIQNPLKVIFDIAPFEQKLNRQIRSDFV